MNQRVSHMVKVLEFVIGCLLLCILIIVLLLVVLRYFFNTSITGANEFIIILFVYATSLGAVIGLAKNEHLSIRFLIDKFQGQWKRRILILNQFSLLLILIVGFVFSLKWIYYTGDYLMPATGLPRWIAQISIPTGCLLSCVVTFFKIKYPIEEFSVVNGEELDE